MDEYSLQYSCAHACLCLSKQAEKEKQFKRLGSLSFQILEGLFGKNK